MDRITTFAALSQIGSDFLNTLQDRVANLRAANGSNDLSSTEGSDGVVWVPAGTVGSNAFPVIDARIDWRDRIVWGKLVILNAATDRPGQSTDYNFHPAGTGYTAYDFEGYVGTGAYGNYSTGAAVDASNTPTNGAGTYRSYSLSINGGAYFVWVDPSTYKLMFYNHSGGAKQVYLRAHGTAKLGKR